MVSFTQQRLNFKYITVTMSYPPASSSPVETRERRRSFLDYGGINSISNFASSYSRAQTYIGSTFLESEIVEDLSPNTSPHLDPQNAIDSTIEEYAVEGVRPSKQAQDQINSFSFPHYDNEESPLIGRRSSRFSAHLPLIQGNSTAPQTIFNSINTLMGIGMLSLPFGLRLSGWFFGSALLLCSAILTTITAKSLGKILKRHPQLNTYGDIAQLYGGNTFSYIVTTIFSIDLYGATVSMILMFTDSFSLLLPDVSRTYLKAFIVTCTFILSLFPLNILSMLSLVGIICTLNIILIILVCGLVVDSTPGSLLVPAVTNLYPVDYKYLLLSIGIFMAPWGGHPVFPELFRDMRHPSKYATTCNVSFSITFGLDFSLAAMGFLMFGASCEDSLVKNVLSNPIYPGWVNPVFCLLMGLLPLSKLPLIAKPIITVYENMFNLHPKIVVDAKGNPKTQSLSVKRVVGRAIFCLILLILSLFFNSFGKLVSFLGSAICYTICLTLPLMFYLHFFKDDLNWYTKIIIRIFIGLSATASVVGTYASITMDIGI